MEDEAYRQEVEGWRRHAEASLRGEYNWLALAGLYWLRDGENWMGTGHDCRIVLPPETASPRAARISLRDGRARMFVEVGTAAMVDGASVQEAELLPDTDPSPTFVDLGRLRFVVVRRGGRVGLRLWDRDNPARGNFPGRQWFPVDERYRVPARFTPYDPPRPTRVVNILGDVEDSTSPGRAVFRLEGRQFNLDASSLDDDGLFFAFSDSTSAVSTYASGRYLQALFGGSGALVLDFNRAYNPPCAFTPFATCELPSPGNRLSVRITAGERYDGSWKDQRGAETRAD
ncbi:MAG: DUF1684 domain-containing protein [Actinobacteria bacterium]|nr:DUF1684 domain-containing protein [Actinomycetota bacterium]